MQLISIVTVVLDDYEGLVKTGDSLARQDHASYEWVVIDGGSERAVELYSAFKKSGVERSQWLSEKDRGIYDAMNKGVRMAVGEYIVFMNAGDVFHDDHVLQRVSHEIENSSDVVDIVLGGADLVFANGREWYRPPRTIESYIWHGLPANHQATYFNRGILGSVPYDLKYSVCGDYYLFCNVHKNGVKSVLIDSPIVKFRVGDTSYRHPFVVLSEAFAIQRDVLDLSLSIRVISFLKRSVSIAGALILNGIGRKAGMS